MMPAMIFEMAGMVISLRMRRSGISLSARASSPAGVVVTRDALAGILVRGRKTHGNWSANGCNTRE